MHYCDPAAKDAGNDSAFAPGMLTGGYVSRMLSIWFGLDAIRRFDMRFHAPVWPGDVVSVEGEVVGREYRMDGALVEVEVAVTTQDDRVVVTESADAFIEQVQQYC